MRTATTLALFLSLATTAAYADSYDYDHPQTTNEGTPAQHPEATSAKNVGEEIGDDAATAAKTVGKTTREVTTTIGHTARDTTKAIGHGTRDFFHGIGNGLRKGWHKATD